jgi:hypothetical protein
VVVGETKSKKVGGGAVPSDIGALPNKPLTDEPAAGTLV